MSFTKKLLRVVSFNYPPFQWFDEPGRNIPVYGYNGQILRALIASLGCEYEVYRTDTWGLPNNGSWNGGMGMLHRDEADLALYPNDANPIKMEVAEHTPTVCPIQLVVMQGRMTKFKKNPFGLVMTLNFEVWMWMVVTLVLTASFMTTAHWLFTSALRSEKVEKQSCIQLFDRYSFMLYSHVWLESAPDPPPNRESIRLSWITWYLMISTILMNAFAGQMKAMMTVKAETDRIDTLRQLALHDEIKIYAPVDGTTHRLLKASTKAHLKKLYQRILKYNTLRLPSELFTRSIYYEVIQGWACVIASPQAMSTRAKEICATMRFGEFYISEEAQINFHAVFHMNLQLDAKIRLAISKRIVWMRESGLLSRWWKNSAGDWSGCQGSDMDQHLEALTIDDVEGMLYILIMCMGVAIIAFIIEFAVFLRRCSSRKIRQSLPVNETNATAYSGHPVD